MIDGVKSDTAPGKNEGYMVDEVTCDNGAIGKWSFDNWGLLTTNIKKSKTNCNISFVTSPNYIDSSGANAPDLKAGMIPVKWDGTNWIVADVREKWYDYDEQMWANAINVTSSLRPTYSNNPGTVVNMNDVLFMWVWVPRYEYQYTNLSTQYAGGTREQPGGINIKFIDKTVTSPDTNYYIHDAFWWDDNNDGIKAASEQLSGIWVAKFDTSAANKNSDTLQDPLSIPNVDIWRSARVGTFWTSIKNNMNSSSGNTKYGLSLDSDTHMMKNMEWGAVAYLSQSKYGKHGNASFAGSDKEVYINNYNGFVTGCSSGTPSAESNSSCSYTYNIPIHGTGASCTGTIYGIYDMSGGLMNYVMGVMKVNGRDEPAVGQNSSYQSGFAGYYYDNTVATQTSYVALSAIGRKYYDLYEYSTSPGDYSKRYHTGDATYETASWFADYTSMVYSDKVFTVRGGYYGHSNGAGVLNFTSVAGQAFSPYTTRIVSIRLS